MQLELLAKWRAHCQCIKANKVLPAAYQGNNRANSSYNAQPECPSAKEVSGNTPYTSAFAEVQFSFGGNHVRAIASRIYQIIDKQVVKYSTLGVGQQSIFLLWWHRVWQSVFKSLQQGIDKIGFLHFFTKKKITVFDIS